MQNITERKIRTFLETFDRVGTLALLNTVRLLKSYDLETIGVVVLQWVSGTIRIVHNY